MVKAEHFSFIKVYRNVDLFILGFNEIMEILMVK